MANLSRRLHLHLTLVDTYCASRADRPLLYRNGVHGTEPVPSDDRKDVRNKPSDEDTGLGFSAKPSAGGADETGEEVLHRDVCQHLRS